MNPEDTIYSRAPARVALAGAGTDLPPYRTEYEGCVVAAAIRVYSYAELRPQLDGSVRIAHLNTGETFQSETSNGLPEVGPLAIFQAMANRLELNRGFEMILSSEVPPSAGLAYRASLGMAAMGALREYRGKTLQRTEMAHQYAAFDGKHFPWLRFKGKHDPFACAIGGVHCLEVRGDRVIARSLVIKESVRLSLEQNGLLFLTPHAVFPPEAAAQFVCSLSDREDVVRLQHRMKANAHSVHDALAVGDLRRLGTLLNEDWDYQRQLLKDFDVTPLDRLLRRGRNAGARGGLVCGLSGGAIFFFCETPETRYNVQRALGEENCTPLPFTLDDAGMKVWSQPQQNS